MSDAVTSEPQPLPLVSRPLLIGWACWLLISWVINLGIDSPIWMSGDALVPAVRGFMQSAILGLGLAWPALRLSQRATDQPGLRVLVDWAMLMLVFQIVLWPLRLLVDWSIAQTLTVDAVFAAWGLAIGCCTWIGWRRATAPARMIAMAVCTMLLGGGLIIAALSQDPAPAQWSPLYMLWTIVDWQHPVALGDVAMRLAVVAAAASFIWMLVGVLSVRRSTHQR